jgi:hypothetical protein
MVFPSPVKLAFHSLLYLPFPQHLLHFGHDARHIGKRGQCCGLTFFRPVMQSLVFGLRRIPFGYQTFHGGLLNSHEKPEYVTDYTGKRGSYQTGQPELGPTNQVHVCPLG